MSRLECNVVAVAGDVRLKRKSIYSVPEWGAVRRSSLNALDTAAAWKDLHGASSRIVQGVQKILRERTQKQKSAAAELTK